MEFDNKVVVIVGGSQGFGKSLAKGFIAEGAKVAIVSRNRVTLEKTALEIGARAYIADVRNERELRDVAKAVIKDLGGIDIWVNSAGLFKKFPKDELLDMDRAHEMFDVNFFGAVLGSRTALLYMKNDGIIVNVLSSAALDATRAVGAKLYAASKWALRGYIDALRSENTDRAVKILSVYPGGMKTHLHDEALPADFDNFMDPEYVVNKVINNLKIKEPETDLIIKRPKM
jgi:NAD(P)-dependent dehydrogenase (short-subunit alcohol dehydrogenase family)